MKLSIAILCALFLSSQAYGQATRNSSSPTTTTTPTALGGQISLGHFVSFGVLQRDFPAQYEGAGTLAFTDDQGQMVVQGGVWVSLGAQTGALQPSGNPQPGSLAVWADQSHIGSTDLQGDTTTNGSPNTTTGLLHPIGNVYTGAHTVNTQEEVIYCNSASPFTQSLPAATGSLKHYWFKNLGTGACTIDAAGADTIDGAGTLVLAAQFSYAELVDQATGNWAVLNSIQSSSVTGGACTNQVVNAISTSGVPTCGTVTASYVDSSLARPSNLQSFTSSGTWTKPSGSPIVTHIGCVGGGGGGASGAETTSGTANSGGGGGGGGAYDDIWVATSSLGSTESVTTGAGGTPGGAVASGAGNVGGNGTASSFGSGNWLIAAAGLGGGGGASAASSIGGNSNSGAGTGGGAGTGNSGAAGSNGSVGGGAGGGDTSGAAGSGGGGSGTDSAPGGGAGGGVSATPTAQAGGASGSNPMAPSLSGGAICTGGTAGSGSNKPFGGSQAGSGGGGCTSAVGGNGGSGALGGGGGGGGGATGHNSGAGGTGGSGACWAETFY